jgi:hypothetical protein
MEIQKKRLCSAQSSISMKIENQQDARIHEAPE